MRIAAATLALLALAACSKSAEAPGESADDFARRTGAHAPSEQVPSVAEIDAQPIAAPTGAAQLTPLAADAPRALGAIKGGCSFVYQGRSLLVVGAPDSTDAAGKGVLVIDGNQVVLPGAAAGGPQVVESGPTLSGNGYTVAVNRADGAPREVAGGNQWGADLVVTGPGGETRFSPGTWTCTS